MCFWMIGCAPVLGVVSSAHLMPLITTVLEDYRNHKHTRVKGLLKVLLFLTISLVNVYDLGEDIGVSYWFSGSLW